jgi:heme A synthase
VIARITADLRAGQQTRDRAFCAGAARRWNRRSGSEMTIQNVCIALLLLGLLGLAVTMASKRRQTPVLDGRTVVSMALLSILIAMFGVTTVLSSVGDHRLLLGLGGGFLLCLAVVLAVGVVRDARRILND